MKTAITFAILITASAFGQAPQLGTITPASIVATPNVQQSITFTATYPLSSDAVLEIQIGPNAYDTGCKFDVEWSAGYASYSRGGAKCDVVLQSASFDASGTLSVTMGISFSAAWQGRTLSYTEWAVDLNTLDNSGWWQIPDASVVVGAYQGAPALGTVSGTMTAQAYGVPSTLTVTAVDTNGGAAVNEVDVMFSQSHVLNNSCLMAIYPQQGILYLFSDDLASWTQVTSSSTAVDNSQCYAYAPSVNTTDISTLSLTIGVEFKAPLVGSNYVDERVLDASSTADWGTIGTFTVTPPPQPVIASISPLSPGQTRSPYSNSLVAYGGVPPYTWSVVAGNLPPGVSLSAGGGLSGTPATAGVFTPTIAIRDAARTTAQQDFVLQIATGTAAAPPPSISMLDTKVGIVRVQDAQGRAIAPTFNLDLNGNGVGPAPNDPADRVNGFAPPGGVQAGDGISQAADVPVVGDWTGDGVSKAGWFRPKRNGLGEWFLDTNNNGVWDSGDAHYFGFGGWPDGAQPDVPVIGDWAGLGKDAIGIVTQGFLWVLDLNADGVFESPTGTNPIVGDAVFAFGGPPDVPVVGNWYNQLSASGHRISQAGVVRRWAPNGIPDPNGGPFLWLLDTAVPGTYANNAPQASHGFGPVHADGQVGTAFGGAVNDMMVAGDWNNEGVSQFGFFRAGPNGAPNFLWVLDWASPLDTQANQGVAASFAYGGQQGDLPITGKWVPAVVTNFTMSIPTPTTVTVTPTGAQASYSQIFQPINGFSGAVGLTYSGAPGVFFSLSAITVSGTASISEAVTVSAAAGTPPGTYNVSITATGAGSAGLITHTALVTVVVTAPPSISIAAPGSFINITNNLSLYQFSMTITGLNGFQSPVSLSAYQYRDVQGTHALPGPAYLTFPNSPFALDPNTGVAVVAGMLQSPSNAAPGSYYYDCIAASGTSSWGFTILVNVNQATQPVDLTVSTGANTVPVSVNTGSSFSFQEGVQVVNASNTNWNGSVTSIGWPSGVSATISPSSFTALPTTLMITISASASASLGSSSPSITVTGTNPSNNQVYSRIIPISLSVGSNPGFNLSATPSARSADSQNLAIYQLNVSGANGFNDTVSFSVAPPTNYTASFTNSSVTGSGATILTVKSPPAKTAKALSFSVSATTQRGQSQTAVLQVSPQLVTNPVGGNINFPPNNGTLAMCEPWFVWDSGTGVSQYQLFVGTGPRNQSGFGSLYTSQPIAQRTAQVSLPSGARKVYATLGSMIDGDWVYTDYVYSSTCGVPVDPFEVQMPRGIYVASGSATLTNDSIFTGGQDPKPYLYYTDGSTEYFNGCRPVDQKANVNALLTQILNPQEMIIQYTAIDDVVAKRYDVVCDWQDPRSGNVYPISVQDGVTVYDGTPVIDDIQQFGPLTHTQSTDISISGRNFGTTATPLTFYTCTIGGDSPSGCALTTDITNANFTLKRWSPELITGSLALPASAPIPTTYYISLTSMGAGGDGNGFQQGNTASTPTANIKGTVRSSADLPVKVFLIHGIRQSSSDMGTFKNNLITRLNDAGFDATKVVVDASFSWPCAQNTSCGSECGISNGAMLLASTIAGTTMPGQRVILIGYSMGGLVARDMLAHAPPGNAMNPPGYPNVMNRTIEALVTLGTPNLGYPWAPVDDAGIEYVACPFQLGQMGSNFRPGQTLTPPTFDPHVSAIPGTDYLRQLASDWESRAFTSALSFYWDAISGSYCSDTIRLGSVGDYGCPNYNSWSDGIVCDQSARFQLSTPQAQDVLTRHIPGHPPDGSLAADGFAHTGKAFLCGHLPFFNTNTPLLLGNPPLGGPVMDRLVQTIMGYR